MVTLLVGILLRRWFPTVSVARKNDQLMGRRSVRRSTGYRKSRDAIRIICEGDVTEVCYIKGLLVDSHVSRDLIRILPSRHTDPVGLVKEAIEHKKKNKRKSKSGEEISIDRWWVVVDVERENNKKAIAEAIRLAVANGILIAFSDPCIEYWLILHFTYTTRTFEASQDAKDYLDSEYLPGYSDSGHRPDMQEMRSRLDEAMKNAQLLRTRHNSQGFESPMTDFDLLVRDINHIVEEEYRFFEDETYDLKKLSMYSLFSR